MSKMERLALEGAITNLEKQRTRLKLQIKGAISLVRDDLSPYLMVYPDNIDIDKLEADYANLLRSLTELKRVGEELKALKEEV